MKKILIIDDEVALVNILAEKLTKAGFEVLQATSAQTGLPIALSQHPDLILLDIVMPLMDGLSLLQELRLDAWGKTAKVFMLTNLAEAEKASEAEALGAPVFLIKAESTLEELTARIGQEFATTN